MEGFFSRCCTVRQTAEIKEFIYRTYQGAARDIFHLPWWEGAEIVNAGREQKQRDDHWLVYCSMYPHMTQDSFVKFDEWYNSLKQEKTPEKIPAQTAEEIMTNVNKIINMTIGGDNGITV